MFVITFYVQTLLNFDRQYDSTLLSFCEYCGQKIKQWRLLQSRLLVILWAMSRCNLIWFDITRSKPESDCSNRKRVALILFSLSLDCFSTHMVGLYKAYASFKRSCHPVMTILQWKTDFYLALLKCSEWIPKGIRTGSTLLKGIYVVVCSVSEILVSMVVDWNITAETSSTSEVC